MKQIIALVTLLNAMNVMAAQQLTCEVRQHVLRRGMCTVCVERHAENCYREEERACLVSALEKTDVKSTVSFDGSSFTLLDSSDDYRFVLSQSQSGHSVLLGSAKMGMTASAAGPSPLNLSQGPFELSLRNDKHSDNEGSVSAVVLRCQLN